MSVLNTRQNVLAASVFISLLPSSSSMGRRQWGRWRSIIINELLKLRIRCELRSIWTIHRTYVSYTRVHKSERGEKLFCFHPSDRFVVSEREAPINRWHSSGWAQVQDDDGGGGDDVILCPIETSIWDRRQFKSGRGCDGGSAALDGRWKDCWKSHRTNGRLLLTHTLTHSHSSIDQKVGAEKWFFARFNGWKAHWPKWVVVEVSRVKKRERESQTKQKEIT